MVSEMTTVEPPVSENPILDKIMTFMNDTSYTDLMQNTAKFNVRIRRDRRYRQPYIDGQTGVAQRDCHLFVSVRQRQEGGNEQGQVFSYPPRRWKAHHRSYLRAFVQPATVVREAEEHIITTVENPAASAAPPPVPVEVPVPPPVVLPTNGVPEGENTEKDPWPYYEEAGFEDLDDEIETDDNDDDETYDRKGRKRKGTGKKKRVKKPKEQSLPERSEQKSKPKKTPTKTPSKPAKKTRNATPADDDDPESKPYVCELCGMRYKTRPGLTYHYSHSHKDHKIEAPKSGRSSLANSTKNTPSPPPVNAPHGPPMPPHQGPPPPHHGMPPHHYPPHYPTSYPPGSSPYPPPPHGYPPHPYPPPPHAYPPHHSGGGMPPHPSMAPLHMPPQHPQDSSESGRKKQPPPVPVPQPVVSSSKPLVEIPRPSHSTDAKDTPSHSGEESKHHKAPPEGRSEGETGKKKVSPSPYCDFCLGDATMNKKTNSAERLVSCADCGRSGHPTCLQFTTNMMKSVSSYRWQCIECKTCTLCGTSENDDQLLFCDDCDRGYHLYCLAPPLAEPPEGEWSCSLCIKNFHNK